MADKSKGGYSPEQLREIAILVAIRTGLLKKCPIHNEIYDPGQHDFQGASMVAAYLVNQSDPLVAAFKDDRTPLTDLLKTICTTHATSCPLCNPPKNGHAEGTSQPKPALSPK